MSHIEDTARKGKGLNAEERKAIRRILKRGTNNMIDTVRTL